MRAGQHPFRTIALAAAILFVAVLLAVRLRAAQQLGDIRQRIRQADHFVYLDETLHFRFEHRPEDAAFDEIQRALERALTRESWFAGWGGERTGRLQCRAGGEELIALEIWGDAVRAGGRGFETKPDALPSLLTGGRQPGLDFTGVGPLPEAAR